MLLDEPLTGGEYTMTKEQRENLLIEWDLCGPAQQKEIINEFLVTCNGSYSQEDWLNFLRDKLEFEECLKNII